MQTDDVIDLAQHLIAIDSVNPTLVPGGAGEHEAARFVEGWAAANGLASRRIASPDGRPNVIVEAVRCAAGDGRLLGDPDAVAVVGVEEAEERLAGPGGPARLDTEDPVRLGGPECRVRR